MNPWTYMDFILIGLLAQPRVGTMIYYQADNESLRLETPTTRKYIIQK